MSPLLPDFTVHDIVKMQKQQDNRQLVDEAKEKGVDVDDLKKAITGKDGWVMTSVINSSNILEIGYKDGKCRVQFKGLKMFEYEPISEDLWMKFSAVKSKGQFFSEHIRNNKKIKAKQIL